MVTIKVLKRNDASSIIVAIALGMIGVSVLGALSSSIADSLVKTSNLDTGVSFASGYLMPLLIFVFEVVFLELALRGIIFLRSVYLKSV